MYDCLLSLSLILPLNTLPFHLLDDHHSDGPLDQWVHATRVLDYEFRRTSYESSLHLSPFITIGGECLLHILRVTSRYSALLQRMRVKLPARLI